MTESELEALCDRANINEEEANDALRTVRLLCAPPPRGIMLREADVNRVLWAAASLHAAMPDMQGVPGSFYHFVEDVVSLLKQGRRVRRPSMSADPMRA